MSRKLHTAVGVLLILVGVNLIAIRFANGRGLFIAAGALMSGGAALEMARRKKAES